MEKTDLPTKKKITTPESPTEKLKYDFNIMFDYATKKGIPLPKQIALDFSNLTENEIVDNYNDLANAIAPATIESIVYVNENIFNDDGMKKWYQIPIYSKNLFISFFALISVIGVSLSDKVNANLLSKSLLESSGLELLLILIFICCSALLGVTFYTMKTMNEKIRTYTLRKSDVLEFNSKILIGVISGFLLSEAFSSFTASLGNSTEITKMTLAILGGFSSDALFSILQGIVDKSKTLLTPVSA